MLNLRPLPLLVFVLQLMTGCSGGPERPDLYQVSGTVTLDGEPLADASVIFEPLSTTGDAKYMRSSNAISDAEGKFQMSTYGENDGLPAGKYKVAVVKQSRKNPPGMDPEMATEEELKKVVVKNLIPVKYFNMDNSGLEVEVTATGMDPSELKLLSK